MSKTVRPTPNTNPQATPNGARRAAAQHAPRQTQTAQTRLPTPQAQSARQPPHVLQRKAVRGRQPSASAARPPRAAPPAYRPQPAPKVLQAKRTAAPRPQPSRPARVPVAPPVYRPQTTPKVLQTKTATAAVPPAKQTGRAPVAPPVYRPQPVPRVLQRKESAAARPPSGQAARPAAPTPVRHTSKAAVGPRQSVCTKPTTAADLNRGDRFKRTATAPRPGRAVQRKPSTRNVIQRVVLFYWDDGARHWGAYENGEEPKGMTVFPNGQPAYEFDWERWENDRTYKDWWQEQMGGRPIEYQEFDLLQQQDPVPQVAQHVAPVAVLQYSAPRAIEGGYMQIDASLNQVVVGRARYSSAPRDVPGRPNQTGIELSEVFVEQGQRGHRYSTMILDHTLQVIGFQQTVWLDAQAQGGLSQGELSNWYGRHGFEAIGHGNIMVAESIM